MNPILRKLVIIFLSLLVLPSSFLKAQEEVIFDETIDWQWTLPQVYGGNSFYWWHLPNESGTINYGTMPTDNWKSPYDYENGSIYLRFEVLDQPTSQSFVVQVGIWQDESKAGGYSECISSNSLLSGGTGSSIEANIGSPGSWWQKRDDAHVDFTRPEDFFKIGLALWKGNGECIPMGQGWNNSNACSNPETEAAKIFPMQAKVTVVAVASGHTFSGWENYPTGGTKPAAPSYTIDYINSRTNEVVPSTDEYSYNSSMSDAISGSGSKLSLTPGQDVYLRTKANGEIQASYIKHLVVAARPSAPAFGYDAVNLRTSSTVSSDYEYADNSSMTGAVSGTGNYVSFPLGSTRYFRKKATASAFTSNVQTLLGTASTGTPEFVILNEVFTYTDETVDNGFFFFHYNSSMPTNWLSPYDFYHGQVYTRYEIISQKTTEPVALQFGIWQRLPVGSEDINDLYESMAEEITLNGPGSIKTQNSSPSTWWTYNGGVDYTQMNNVWHFGINPWNTDPFEQIRSEKTATWALRNIYWYPMKVKITVVAVADGYTFSGWDNYVSGTGAAPEFHIDYAAEQTTEIVTPSVQYSYNQSSWNYGTSAKLTLTPGQNVYFRNVSSPSDVSLLTVPARSAAPAFAIDFLNERTTAAVSSAYQYSVNENMSSSSTGTGQPATVTPGTTLYIREIATASKFASEKQALVVPSRPEAPVIGVDFINLTTSVVVTSSQWVSINSNMSGASLGNGTKIAITPGTDLYIRQKGTSSQFASEILHLVVPQRPVLSISLSNPVSVTPVPITVTFSNTVTGFTAEDLVVTNGTAQSVAGNFTANIKPTVSGNVRVSIPANVVNEGNFASEALNFTYQLQSALEPGIEQSFVLYPTCTQDNIFVTYSGSYSSIIYEIIDYSGVLVKKGEITGIGTSISVANLPKGLFLMRLNIEGTYSKPFRFIKE
jgi:hypothetical protein